MTRRPAATLIEVLVSIFIMGIGLLAILALFPLGALRMAQAIQDDRTAHIAANAAAVAQALELRKDAYVTTAFTNPPAGLPPVHPDRPSYPAYVDPIGYQTYLAPLSGQVGGTTAVPRIPVGIVLTGGALDNTKILRWFTFLDDLKFDTTGVPAAPVDREGVYSYAVMMRRPRSSLASVVDMTVVVYSRRPLSPRGDFTGDEFAYTAAFNPSGNLITLTVGAGQSTPPLRPGSWLLDATTQTETIGGQQYGWANAYFYRAVNVTQLDAVTYEIETATPLRGWPAAGGTGTVVVMDGVVEVLEKGAGRTP